jgi:hypothetical protein
MYVPRFNRVSLIVKSLAEYDLGRFALLAFRGSPFDYRSGSGVARSPETVGVAVTLCCAIKLMT